MLKGSMVPGEAPADAAILTRLGEADYLAVARLAEAADESLSGYVRRLVRRHLAVVEPAQ